MNESMRRQERKGTIRKSLYLGSNGEGMQNRDKYNVVRQTKMRLRTDNEEAQKRKGTLVK